MTFVEAAKARFRLLEGAEVEIETYGPFRWARPWWTYDEGIAGFGLIFASLGGLLAVLVR